MQFEVYVTAKFYSYMDVKTVADSGIIDANSVKVTNVLNGSAFKKEYVALPTLNDVVGSASLEPAHVIARNKVAFITTFAIATWDDYPIGLYTINANESIVSVSLADHAPSGYCCC
jgi:GH43 family beta-xylosidase